MPIALKIGPDGSGGQGGARTGGSTRGHAAGVGDVDIRNDRPRMVADVGPTERSARLVFNRDGTPRMIPS